MKPDKKDCKIISELDANPKISISSLAKHVRLSQQVTDYRFKRLQQKNVITSCSAIINPAMMGCEQYRLFFQLETLDDKEKSRILRYLNKHPHVYWAAQS
ncbi:winged helix-turn-helix transcriptional regulator [Candidatus Woesearchaeota archaeon]|nr:winged helix-turn-helix transcriptional regulator [Candidatus Woesearchaeota archaeon]